MSTDAPARVLAPEDLRRPPQFATRRNPDLRTRGGKVGVLAAELGKPLLPHQQYIADVALELNPPGSRLRYRYQLVVISLPRQTGKTTLMRPIFLERTIARPGTQAFMTAQLGKDSRARWQDLVEDLRTSVALGLHAKITESNGSERLSFPNSSFISPFAPGPKALHGYSPPLVFIDEAWAFSDLEGADLMKAIRPAMQTKVDRQLFIVSAAGHAGSEWWNRLVDAGRASVDDPASTMAYFEWSMDETMDPYDPASWEFHPGLDGLITTDDLAQEANPEANTLADFLRGFMNVATKTRANTVIPVDVWDDLVDAGQTPPEDPDDVVYGYDVARDRSKASIWAAWRDRAGRMQLHVYDTRDGADWLPAAVVALLEDGRRVVGDDGGPARHATRQIERAGHTVETLNGSEYVTGWTGFKAMVTDGELRHDGSPALREAIQVASERPAGDNLALSRRYSLGPIDPLVSAVVATARADQGAGLFIG